MIDDLSEYQRGYLDASLSGQQLAILKIKNSTDMTNDEIGNKLGIATGTVHKQLQRIREKIEKTENNIPELIH